MVTAVDTLIALGRQSSDYGTPAFPRPCGVRSCLLKRRHLHRIGKQGSRPTLARQTDSHHALIIDGVVLFSFVGISAPSRFLRAPLNAANRHVHPSLRSNAFTSTTEWASANNGRYIAEQTSNHQADNKNNAHKLNLIQTITESLVG